MEISSLMAPTFIDESFQTIVAQFVWDKFQKRIMVLKKLPSYEDTNLLIQSSESSSDSQRLKFVLKIFCHDELGVDFFRKIESVNYLKSRNFLCSEFILGMDGNYLQSFEEKGIFGKKSALLYSFLEGKELEHTGYTQYPIVISELGSFLAYFHHSLKDVQWMEDLAPNPDDPWNLSNYALLQTESYLEVVEDQLRRQKLLSVLEYVVKTLDASKGSLSKDILHGDFHGLNIIVSESYKPSDRSPFKFVPGPGYIESVIAKTETEETSSSPEELDSLLSLFERMTWIKSTSSPCKELLGVYGIIDFDAISYSYTVLEVGRLIADVMVTYLAQGKSNTKHKTSSPSVEDRVNSANVCTEFIQSSKEHLLKIGGYVLAGYMLIKSLSLDDVKCVYPAMLTSLCQYYLLGTKSGLDRPNSVDYVAYCSQEAMVLLELFYEMEVQNVVRIWQKSAKDILDSHQSQQINLI